MRLMRDGVAPHRTPLPRLLMPRIAPRSYARYARTLHDTSTP